MKTLILGQMLIDGTGGDPLWDPAILIEGERIERILTQDQAGDLNSAGFRTINCPDKAILPGLIDGHVHLTFDGGPDHETARQRTVMESERGLLPFRAVRNAQRALLGGVTTLRDSGGLGLVTLALRDAIQNGILIGPRILTAGMPITTSGGHLNFCGLRADDDQEIREAVQMLCSEGVDSIKVCATGGRMTAESDPLACQYTAEQLSLIVQEAHRFGRKVEAHVLNTAAIDACVRAGVDIIAHCWWVGTDGATDYRPYLVDAIVRQNQYVAMTAAGFFRMMLPALSDSPDQRRAKLEELRGWFATMRRMWEAGVKIILHSDAGVRLTDFDTLVQSMQVMELALDVSPMDIIQAVTRMPAEGLGLENELGTIEVGKRADLLLVEMNPLEDIRCVGRVHMVIRGGEAVVANGGLVLGTLEDA
jgi:imidazolonepropionase-like amidohydrolase